MRDRATARSAPPMALAAPREAVRSSNSIPTRRCWTSWMACGPTGSSSGRLCDPRSRAPDRRQRGASHRPAGHRRPFGVASAQEAPPPGKWPGRWMRCTSADNQAVAVPPFDVRRAASHPCPICFMQEDRDAAEGVAPLDHRGREVRVRDGDRVRRHPVLPVPRSRRPTRG